MTVVPNLLLTGILAILASLAFLLWATIFVHGKHGGLVLIVLSTVMLLVGGGFGPPMMGIILGIAATRINAPSTWWREHLSIGVRRSLSRLWPWAFVIGLITWLSLFPGSILLGYFFNVNNLEVAVSILIFSAFGLLLLTIFTGLVHDAQRHNGLRNAPSQSR